MTPNKSKSLAITLSLNILLVFGLTFVIGAIIAKTRTGKWHFSTQNRTKLLRPDNCKEFKCAGFADYNDIQKTKTSPTFEPAHCIVSNPIFGYYNICTKGELGLSKETEKNKQPSTYRALLVGGSQANINTMILENELNKHFKKYKNLGFNKAEVFGAAIGGGKQPMQLQTANALLGMGYEFNSIININGWNEIMLATLENKQAGIPPIYPRSHVDRLVLEQRNLSAESSVINCTSLDSALGWHPGYTIWSYQCIKNQRNNLAKNQNYGIIRLKLKLDNTAAKQDQINEDALRAWQISSQNLDALSLKQDLDYIEVIQPTTSTDSTNTACYVENFSNIYSRPAAELVPNINNTLLDLRSMSSIPNIFTDCVHLNDTGSTLMAQKIIKNLKF